MRTQIERNTAREGRASRQISAILKFNPFLDPAVCGPTAAAAMNFLGNVDAMIFDLCPRHANQNLIEVKAVRRTVILFLTGLGLLIVGIRAGMAIVFFNTFSKPTPLRVESIKRTDIDGRVKESFVSALPPTRLPQLTRVMPMVMTGSRWNKTVDVVSTSGPLANGHGRIVGGSREFEGLTG
jgi:hypothetical protein